jgi:hypothetical protein
LLSSALMGLTTRYYFLLVCCCLKFVVLFLSGERTGLQFAVQSLSGPSRAEPVTILYCLIWDCPNLEGQVPLFISPRNRVAQLHPRELDSICFASCHSQGYGGGILTLSQPGGPGARTLVSLKNRMIDSKVKGKVTLRPTVSQSICLVPSPRGFRGALSERISIRHIEGTYKRSCWC